MLAYLPPVLICEKQNLQITILLRSFTCVFKAALRATLMANICLSICPVSLILKKEKRVKSCTIT